MKKEITNFETEVKVNQKYLNEGMKGEKIRAIGFLCTIKAIEKAIDIHCWTVNSIHQRSGIHAKTVEKRIVELEEMGLVEYDAKGRICFLRMKSNHANHNVKIKVGFDDKGVKMKDVEDDMFIEKIIHKLRQMDYMRQKGLQIDDFRNNPCRINKKGDCEQYKKTLKYMRKHGKGKDLNWGEDYGWSIENIARYLGVSVRTAQRLMNKAEEEDKIEKEKNIIKMAMTSDFDKHFVPHTYIKNGNLIIVMANKYTIKENRVA